VSKEELIRDLCSVEFRTKSKTRELINQYTKQLIETPMGVSQWLNYGKKYGYYKYFAEQVLGEVREIIIKSLKV
jgi:hypothetical protein